jgi:hypothetical protein
MLDRNDLKLKNEDMQKYGASEWDISKLKLTDLM